MIKYICDVCSDEMEDNTRITSLPMETIAGMENSKLIISIGGETYGSFPTVCRACILQALKAIPIYGL